MKIPKPSSADMARFRSLVPEDPRVEVKPMFGNLAAFVNGNMFMGLFGADVGLKLAPGDADALRAIDGAAPFGPADRPMGGYVTLPPSLLDGEAGQGWIARALDYVGSLPPKVPRR